MNKKLIRSLINGLISGSLCCALLVHTAHAAADVPPPPPAHPTAQHHLSVPPPPLIPVPQPVRNKAAVLAQIQHYINNLHSFSASFQQIVEAQPPATGHFYFMRPGKFLWRYDAPDPMRLISNGGLIYFVDDVTKQVTQVPRDGISDLLLRQKLDLSAPNIKIDSLVRTGGLLELTMTLKQDDDAELTAPSNKFSLTFLEQPLQLRQLTTIDQLGQAVDVVFFQIQENQLLDKKIFDYTPPQYQEN